MKCPTCNGSGFEPSDGDAFIDCRACKRIALVVVCAWIAGVLTVCGVALLIYALVRFAP